jgi:hypothetical protein
VLVERPGDAKQSAIDVQQIAEVNRSFLVVFRDLFIENGVNRLADDRRF